MPIDNIDRAIIRELQANAKATLVEIAEQVGLSKTPCQQRIKRLEKDGVIRGYTTRVNHRLLGESHVVFVQVKLANTRTVALRAFNEAVWMIPEIEECHMMAANYDYLLKVRTGSMGSFRAILGEKISALPHVQQTSTFVAMENVKD
ncbi:MAG: proline dehydrogenase transcriptional activator [Gammaproteobacteria bacterium]|nr:MAG: proline dehydrogenase transcriptional activator [Gammaproteobacteria bacterium]